MLCLFFATFGVDNKIIAILSPIDRLAGFLFVDTDAFFGEAAEPDIEDVLTLVAGKLCLKLVGDVVTKTI